MSRLQHHIEQAIAAHEAGHRNLTADHLAAASIAASTAAEQLRRIEKFVHAYWMADALTFVNPDNGELVSATYEVRAFASALLRGPMSDT